MVTNLDKLAIMGDRSAAVPFSLIFSRELTELDVRVWLCIRAMYDAKQLISMHELAEIIGVSYELVYEAMQVLTIHRWFVWNINQGKPVNLPRISTNQLGADYILSQENDEYLDDLKYLSEKGKSRAQTQAKVVLGQINTDVAELQLAD